MSVVVRGVTKSFGAIRALDDVDVTVESGALAALLGPSGCGKTTLLRTIAGFEQPDAGRVVLDGEDVTHRPLGKRDVGFVFQNYALFPHQTVAENIGFALSVRKRSRSEIRERVGTLLDLVQLGGFEQRRPHELSGGQRQRVALARALAAEPSILLLDEPFGALDARVRKDLRRWLRALHERTHVTTLLVTHDAEEAMEIADRIVVLRDGRVQQEATPRRIYGEPANPFVMEFVGNVNAVRGDYATIYVRPSDFRIESRHFGHSNAASVERVHAIGARTQLDLVLTDGQRVTAELDDARAAALAPQLGMTVYLEATRFRAFEGALA
jgi:sulfate transport system ATP-binding protein